MSQTLQPGAHVMSFRSRKIGLFLDTEPYGGGKFQYCQAMLEAVVNLPEERFKKVIAYTSRGWEKYLEPYKNQIKTIFVSGGWFRWFFERVWRNLRLSVDVWRKINPLFFPLARQLRAEECDLWIFPAEETLTYQIDVPALSTIFDLMHRYEPRFPEVAALGRASRRDWHYKKMCAYAKGLLVDSEVGKNQVIESYQVDENKVFVLPYIVPPYMHRKNNNKTVDKKYNLPSKYIFYPAQFWEHKNHKNLLQAAALLKDKIADLKLVFVGSKKNAYESVLRLVQELGLKGQVLFPGYVSDEDMVEIYRGARAMIMPTFFGPTNIPPLEAFVTGCPAAVSNIYGMPEQVGDAALLFDPSSPREIAEVIEKLWNDDELCRKLAEKGKKRAASWGQPQFNQRLKEIIEKILTS